MVKNKHMTLDDRIEIQRCLDQGMTFKTIAKRLGKDQTTISKEVKKHIAVNTNDLPIKKDHTGKPVAVTPCPQLLRAPFVCNGCKRRRTQCSFQKCVYYAKNAQQEYEALLKESREGIPLNKDEFYKVDAIIAEGIKKGQHLYHIMNTHDLGVSKATVYRHLHRGYLSVSKIDFPRVVKFKPRKQRREDKIPKAAKNGRTYQDFLSYIEENGITTWTEMDTVIGSPGGKVIMTFDFTLCNFMFGLLLDNKTSAEAARSIRSLKEKLFDNGIHFGDVIPLLLTDNGGEFADVSAFIADVNGEIENSLFFCEPYSSFQKPRVEKNHTLFRDIVPKGVSFDSFTQDTVDLIFSHVNNVKRKSLNGKSPYEIFRFTFGEKMTSLLGIDHIPPEEVIQSPKLITK
ncbi:MAG: IS30 family transposase [Saccharofermentanales bacterium]